MRSIRTYIAILVTVMLSLNLCGCKNTDKGSVPVPEEDSNAKRMLQGIWVSDDDGSVVMKVKGDSIVYADSTQAAVSFAIYGDTLVTKSYSEARYAIIKQTEHIFQFNNATGDAICLVKSDDPNDASVFDSQRPAVLQLNQGQVIKRDSVLFAGDKRLHAYVQVNPSTYKVITSSVNENGMQSDNVYYDNVIHIAVFDGAEKRYSKDIVKQDFTRLVPKNFLAQAVLSDITIVDAGSDGVHFLASILQPDSQTSYQILLTASLDGKLGMKLSN